MIKLSAGVDEAGRGPLAGPVVAAAVILDGQQPYTKVKDSKKLSALQRDKLFDQIYAQAVSIGVGLCTAQEIDKWNILQASLIAMQRALAALSVAPTEIWVDGNQCPQNPYPVAMTALIKGDSLLAEISAASIIAKVTRDRLMVQYHQQYPEYGFLQHKGYPTPSHLANLQQWGPCPLHRLSFAPVARLCTMEPLES